MSRGLAFRDLARPRFVGQMAFRKVAKPRFVGQMAFRKVARPRFVGQMASRTTRGPIYRSKCLPAMREAPFTGANDILFNTII